MLATVIWDVYTKDDASAVRNALEDAASPKDNIGWSSSGVYAFYDPIRRPDEQPLDRLKYVGLATGLPQRFAQHNGMISSPRSGSKFEQIADWFEANTHLGFAAFVQSPLHQAFAANYKRQFDGAKFKWDADFIHDHEARKAIALIEGQLIQSKVSNDGKLPAWNKIGGSKEGRDRAKDGSGIQLLRLMEGSIDNLFVARRSLREMESDSSVYFFESSALHTARMNALQMGVERPVSNREILQHLASFTDSGSPYFDSLSGDVRRMNELGYLDSTSRSKRAGEN